jgi:hypothetical protein
LARFAAFFSFALIKGAFFVCFFEFWVLAMLFFVLVVEPGEAGETKSAAASDAHAWWNRQDYSSQPVRQ